VRRLLTAIAVGLAVAGAASAASEPPTAYGDAYLGSLHVTSGILVSATAADMRGVWLDAKVGCFVTRKLKVKAQVYLTPFGKTGTRRLRVGTFADANCAEGGPNVGFTLSARKLGYACANGYWRPGRFSFVVQTTEPTRGLRATASLSWANTGRC
jgi:hypothetical protein